MTWNYDNALAGGALEKAGLTDLGKYAVDFLNRNGIVVDTAHLNAKSFFDVSERAERIINSHTFIPDLHPHPRNISFCQAAKIVSSGGLVGMTPVNAFTRREDLIVIYAELTVFCSVSETEIFA